MDKKKDETMEKNNVWTVCKRNVRINGWKWTRVEKAGFKVETEAMFCALHKQANRSNYVKTQER